MDRVGLRERVNKRRSMMGRGQEVDSQCGALWNMKPSVPEFQNASADHGVAVNPTDKMKDTLA